MKNANLYSQLLETLRPPAGEGGCFFGTLTALAPLTVEVGGGTVSQGLCYPRGMTFAPSDVGRRVALLPAPGGLALLFITEGGES